MAPDQRPDGQFECPDCRQTYDAEASLAFCCNPAALARYGGDDD